MSLTVRRIARLIAALAVAGVLTAPAASADGVASDPPPAEADGSRWAHE